MTSPTNGIYLLRHNVDQIPDDQEVTFRLISPPNLYTFNIEKAQLLPEAERPVFYSFAEPFEAIDYPITDQVELILSRKALGFVEQFPDHGCQTAGITVINATLDTYGDPREHLQDDSDLIAASRRDRRYFSADYRIVEPPLIPDLLDHEQSGYRLGPSGQIGFVERFVFKKEADTLPPLFRIPEHLGHIFITGKLRKVWHDEGITGTAFSPTSELYRVPDVDVPLKQRENPLS